MTDYEDRIQATTDSFLKHREMEEQADYLNRGGKFRELSDADLRDRWIMAIRKWHTWETDRSEVVNYNDLSAELGLRKIGLPFEVIADVLQAIQEEIRNIDDGENDPKIRELIRSYMDGRSNGN